MSKTHFEPFLHLVGLSHEAALIAWGGFYFHMSSAEDGWQIIDDEQLHTASLGRTESIGARSDPYGRAEVEVRDPSGTLAARATTEETNHVLVPGLRPDTAYTYRVIVDGKPWAEGARLDWGRLEDGRHGLRTTGRRYENRFRTYPDPRTSAPLTFAVIGDFGIGIIFPTEEAQRQLSVARALERVVVERDVRLVLTTGDNIYLGPEHTVAGSGHEDDDWYFSFYQPYRYILNRIPVYPAPGNHDSAEQENSDDRGQLEDNFFTKLRFEGDSFEGQASPESDLCYRFRYGKDIEFICIDTSLSPDQDKRFFECGGVEAFVGSALPDSRDGAGGCVPWRIPFCHHPPYCAGPHHSNMDSMIGRLVPLFERAGVQVVLSGHEHNFQCSRAGGITYIVTGAGGKLREDPPTRFSQAYTQAWAVEGHFLLVEIDDERMELTPIAGLDGRDELRPIRLQTPDGGEMPTPIVVSRER